MELHNYQKETLDILRRMEKEYDNFSTVVNLPTGSGKTQIAVNFCNNVLKDKKGKILWLADKNEILRQADGCFQKDIKRQRIFAVKKNDNDIAVVNSNMGELYDKKADIIFATVGSMAKIYKRQNTSFKDWVGDNKLYVIYDEAHHIGASQAFNLFTSLFSEKSNDNAVKFLYHIKSFAIVGFTATVYRMDKFIDAFKAFFKDGYNKENDSLYHSESNYGEYVDVDIASIDEIRVAVADINDLIEGYEGEAPVLVEPQIIKVDEFVHGMPPRKEKPEDKDKSEYLEDTNVYKNNEYAMQYLANRIVGNKSKWGKLAVIVNNIEEAKALCNQLGTDALRCTYDVGDPEAELEKFKNDKSGKILVTVHKFDEGIDVPDLETLYLFAKTHSQIILRQRIGRVVRKAENKEKVARVIWQQYPEDEKYLSKNEFQKLLNSSYRYNVQTEKEQEKDYVTWSKNPKLQLPAIMYRKPLQTSFQNYSEWMLLRAEELFGTDIISTAKSIGFFYNADEYESTEDAIFVRNVEYEGYLQLQRLLHNDWISLLRYEKKNITFEDYAGILGVSVGELLKDIKEVCFYQKDFRYEDSFGSKVSQRIFVRDGEIRTFFKWFISGKIEYMNLSIRKRRVRETAEYKELFKSILDSNYVEKSLDCKTTSKKLQDLKAKLEEQNEPDEDNWKSKEYTEQLTYGGSNMYRDIYQEMLSKKLMMRAGVTDILPRIVIDQVTDKEGKKKDIDAFNGVKCVRRKSNTIISKDDWILYASALMEIPNHIYITQEDVNEYEKVLRGSVLVNVPNDKKEQAVKECLLALGYVKNKEIIKYQCQKINGVLPKVLQYVIYQICYMELSKEIKFVKNDAFHPKCVNESLLEEKYNYLLSEFGVQSSQMQADLVKDVIYDYRPYLKAVYYYQGIKPEFLCRMANDIIELSKNKPNRIIDGFGGSGACVMNRFFTNMQPKQVYNDLGIMNTAFYKCLQSPELKGNLIKEIQRIIDDAFSMHRKNEKIQYLSRKYGKFVSDSIKDRKNNPNKKPLPDFYWNKTIGQCEKDYIDAYNKRINPIEINLKASGKGEYEQAQYSYRNVKIEDRLYYMNQKEDGDIATIRSVERYFHVFMLQLNTVYLAVQGNFSKIDIKYGISDVDLAVLFFFYNTLSHRHFYNDCTIGMIGKMIKNYEKWLGYGAECFKNVDIIQEDANILLGYETYNKEKTTWYLDIPYAETDSSDYVAQWFDMKTFINALSKLEGNYIVSSRCNICLPNAEKRELIKISRDDLKDIPEDEIVNLPSEGKASKRYVKELNVFSFFSSFVDDADEVMEFIESLEVENIAETEGKKITTTHISKDKKAKYILIPYTKMSEEYYDEDDKVKGSFIENSSVISEDYVRRMLVATHYSNVPVDIMVTDIDIDLNKMPIQPAYSMEGKESESVYVLPTFKTGVDASQYMTEPVVVIMKYDKFMEILCSILYREEWRTYRQDKSIHDSAELFRNIFKMG